MNYQLIKPAIVVVAYNRPDSLQRLLSSIAQADYSGYNAIDLIISIDCSNSSEVLSIANNFVWEFGQKEVIQHSVNLGLKTHIIRCGDLAEKYEAVIILEDDLIVSPAFYNYTCQALNYYQDISEVAGISLYSYFYNEYAQVSFIPLDDGFDNYFLQSATSWGQCWTRKQWQNFKNWYQINQIVPITENDDIPNKVVKWPNYSWKKYFIKFLVAQNKYFVIPRISLSTNCAEQGTNIIAKHGNYQAYLLMQNKKFKFSNLRTSQAIYDSHYELEGRTLSTYNKFLSDFDLECDFYGTKSLNKIQSEYIITIRDSWKPLKSYRLELLPQELNVAFNLDGNFFNLTKVNHCKETAYRKKLVQYTSLHQYAGIKRWAALSAYSLIKKFSFQF